VKRRLKTFSQVWLTGWFGAALIYFCFHHSDSIDLSHTLEPASLLHPFGFDAFGKDLLASLLRASLLSAGVALVTVLFSCLTALILGSALAFAPGTARFAFLRFLETLLAFPSLLLALAWAAIRGPSWNTLVVSLMLGILPSFTRFVYVRVRELRDEEFILASKSLGADTPGIIWRHIFPWILSLCKIQAPFLFAHALLGEATLSFIGTGAPIGRETWGALLAEGKDYLLEAPHIAIASGIPLVLTVLAFQWIADRKSVS
jgi:peptide/nickel transport system permease protein